MNHDGLRNRYSVMRHGQSKANLAGIIVSRIETDASGDYGLTDLGRQQASAAVRSSSLPAGTLICSSDFARAAQTAQIAAEHLKSPGVRLARSLRERSFGAWDGMAAANYQHAWAADVAGHGDGDVEPAAAVLSRLTALIADLEREHDDRDILLVSHGDPLQILQAGFQGMDPARHRSVPHLETGEIRRLVPAAR